MLFRHRDFDETLVHQCADAEKYTTSRRREMANVRVHDISAYLVVPAGTDHTQTAKIVHIRYCPFCGVELEQDGQTGEFLDFTLL